MIVRDFNASLLAIDKNSWKGSRRFEQHTLKLALKDRLGNTLSIIRKIMFFLCIHGTFTKLDHVLAHK